MKKVEMRIHHDLAYAIQRGMSSTGLEQGICFSPHCATFTLPGQASLLIFVKEGKLSYKLQHLIEEKEE